MPKRQLKIEQAEHILRKLRQLKGVKHAFYLDTNMRTGLKRIEKQYPVIGPLTVANEGVLQCLSRKYVACIVKSREFRAPPHPTVVLVNETGEVIGREILPKEKVPERPGRKNLMIGKDFVLFVGEATGKGARFVLPPVAFKEVERMKGTSCVMSSSPSTAGDLFLRKSAGLKDDPRLASILIGFDLS